ncbi:MAG: hypothetical protein WC438_05785 [Candidatus Pacearchaeota archaeon]|jgi:hypothetical protein
MENIKVGDIVNIHFNEKVIHDVEILYIPLFPGDYFRLKNSNGDLFNVQQYNYMVKYSRED